MKQPLLIATVTYKDDNTTPQLPPPSPPHTHTHIHAYLSTLGTQVMLGTLEVNGEATLASVSDREMPAWAIFRAWERGGTIDCKPSVTLITLYTLTPQSLAPSPHMAAAYLKEHTRHSATMSYKSHQLSYTSYCSPNVLQSTHKLCLLIRGHPGKYCTSNQQLK